MAANQNAAAVADALREHDRQKKSTDIPLFHAKKDKDTVTARELIVRVQNAAAIGNWDAARKYHELETAMRGAAATWWETLADAYDIADGNWDAAKQKFLETYDPKSLAKTTSTLLSEMHQKTGENVREYHARINLSYKKMVETKPAEMKLTREADQAPAGANAETLAFGLRSRLNGIKEAERFILMQLFVAGLKEDIRLKTIEAGEVTIGATIDTAATIEVVLNDKKNTPHINEIKEDGTVPSNTSINAIEIETEMNDEELEAVNFVRAKRGQPLWKRKKFNGNFNNRSSNNGNNKNNYNSNNRGNNFDPNEKCRYCKKAGHRQRECRSRIRAGAPMVDAQGKPYTSKVSEINEANHNSVSGIHLNF